jgi:GTP cyclohydrolase II
MAKEFTSLSPSNLLDWLKRKSKIVALPRVCNRVFAVPLKRSDLDGLMQAAFITKAVFGPQEEHALFYKGEIDKLAPGSEVLIRINSACFTGDIFHDQSCDCNEQFEISLKMMVEHQGPALVIYHFAHEGKAHGYYKKLKAFDGQMYPVKGDHRDFRTSVAILRNLGISRVRLMTNNPEKVKILQDYGIEVAGIVPIVVNDPNLAAFYDYKARIWKHELPRIENDTAA